VKKSAGSILAILCLVACSVVPGCSREEPIPDRTKKLYSQSDEELIIRDFFDDRKGGFFVDVGSAHWEELSNTFFLEKYLGWGGIAIDAQAGFAEGYQKFRPKTKFFSYAVSDKSGETLKLHLLWGMSSVDPNWHKQFTNGEDRGLKAVDVPTITLNDLLEQNHVAKIDFLSMDIEGAEPAALAGFDIEKYKPALVCIEAAAINREVLAAYFDKHGYERIDERRDATNWYLKPKAPSRAAGSAHGE
jgi:FkbM family methyltransferase